MIETLMDGDPPGDDEEGVLLGVLVTGCRGQSGDFKRVFSSKAPHSVQEVPPHFADEKTEAQQAAVVLWQAGVQPGAFIASTTMGS